MAKLIINRAQYWIGKNVNVQILLNDKKIGVLESGEQKEFEISSERQHVQIKKYWYKSKKQTCDFNVEGVCKLEVSWSPLSFFIV